MIGFIIKFYTHIKFLALFTKKTRKFNLNYLTYE